jgi:RimJ/RimL family protein N-acetyltransferase
MIPLRLRFFRSQITEISIRPLSASYWATFREIRLGVLLAEPEVFSSSYEEALTRTEAYWRETASGNDKHQVFALFDGASMIGITAVFTHRRDSAGTTAILAMSFIEPEYRGRGLSRLLYQERLDWVRAHPQFKRVVVSHRESNEASRRANQHFGFRYLRRESRAWPDGAIEDEIHYELPIVRELG